MGKKKYKYFVLIIGDEGVVESREYYDKESAIKYAKKKKKEGYDVFVYRVREEREYVIAY